MNKLKSFKEFIGESFWGDVHKRSRGDEIRKEDDVDLMDMEEFYEYTQELYSDAQLYIDIHRHEFISVDTIPVYGRSKQLLLVFDWTEPENKQMTLPYSFRDNFENVFNKMTEKFSLEYPEAKDDDEYDDYLHNEFIYIHPKDGKKITNRFYIEVLDYIIKVANGNLTESFWGDVHKRSIGDAIRKEDDPFDLGKRAVEISKAIKVSPVKDDYTLLEIENEKLFNTDFICRRDTKYNLDINSDETCKKISILKQDFNYHRDNCIPYFLYVHNEIPIDDEGNTTSLWLEYGVVSEINEEECEPANWYYLKNEDQWVSDYHGKFKENLADEFLIETFRAITPVINPNTKYKNM